MVFCDPATGRRIATLEDGRARANAEREARVTVETELSLEREARINAEARVRELEELLHRQSP